VILSRSQFGCFHQCSLDMFVALFREGSSHDLVGRTFLVAAEATVADRLLDRPKRVTSPISSAHVKAVIGPTPGTVRSCLILSANRGSRWRELTRAYSVFCNRTIVSLLSRSSGRMLS
jgi:hypothetical protein